MCLKHLADRDQRKDHGCRFKVELMHVLHDLVHIPGKLRPRHRKQRVGAVHKRCGGSERHQRIHIWCAVDQPLKAAYEELLVDHHDDACQQKLQQAHRNVIAFKESRQRPVPHHMSH